MKKFKMICIVFSILIIVGGIATALFIEPIPPTVLTYSRISGIMVRILQYISEHNDIPRDLTVLPERPGKDNSIIDAWKRPIRYSFEDGKFTLTSYGKNGIPGGRGKDADIVLKFTLGALKSLENLPGGEWPRPQIIESD